MSGKLEQRIQSAHLTRTEKVIADYFLEHSGSLYFLTAKDIALALGVSDTSVIRLCRTLGYRGFRELQESLRSCCRSIPGTWSISATQTPAA